jgi:hypothetical protein
MRMTIARSLAADYHGATLSVRRKIILKFWESDGLPGLETLAYLLGEPVHQLASLAGIIRNVARARARRERDEKRRPRQPIPRGFRQELRAAAEAAGHGRGFIPAKRHWEPLSPSR